MITILLQKILEQVKALKTNIENMGGGSDYSRNETKIGKWIDGKDLYRKTLTDADRVDNVFDLTSLNINTFVGFDSANYLMSNRSITSMIYYNGSNDYCSTKYNNNNHKITFTIGTGMTVYSTILTILYTKN